MQSFLFPTAAMAARSRLYARSVAASVFSQQGGLPIAGTETIDLCTFFNAFSLRKWRKLTGLERLSLALRGEGEISVGVATYTSAGVAREILSTTLTLREGGTTLDLPPLSSLSGEVIGVRITGTGGAATLTRAAWTTTERPRRDIRLAAVITTFQREAAVRRAMESFSAMTCARPPLGSVELYVIDNDQRLPASTLDKVKVFSNPNLGGAGGFTRGLIEAIDAGVFTHVLFMDDDAACEPESVWRCMTLLGYATEEGLAVAGAMLFNNDPCIQYEKGALLETTGRTGHIWRSQRHVIDLARLDSVCANEPEDEVNYGAWWFFAFPLSHVKCLPFPFFVRGDDVDFSLSNAFKVVTLNGVATWCDAWTTKAAPTTEYLAWRAWMALALMHGSSQAAFLTLWNTIKVAQGMAEALDYGSMTAVLDGIEDAMNGPETFTANPAPLKKLKSLKASQASPVRSAAFRGWLRRNKVLWRHRFRLNAARARYKALAPPARTRTYWEPLIGGKRSAT